MEKDNSQPLNQYPAWGLEEASSQFSEVVRKAGDTPQRVTLHGKDTVMVISVEAFAQLLPAANQLSLRELLVASPLGEIDFDSPSVRPTVREPEF